jgi:hypothetical protein
MFPKWHKQTIDIDPMPLRKFVFEGRHCFFGCGGFYVSPAIGHTVNVDIYADEGLFAGNP